LAEVHAQAFNTRDVTHTLSPIPVSHFCNFPQGADDLSPEDITFSVAGEIQPLAQQLEDLKRLLTLSVLLSHILAYDITGC
jgi:hypothetical protein